MLDMNTLSNNVDGDDGGGVGDDGGGENLIIWQNGKAWKSKLVEEGFLVRW